MPTLLRTLFSISIISLGLTSCFSDQDGAPLPYLGRHTMTATDTLYHTIPDWKFLNQDSSIVTNKSLSNTIYISDFFFTSCPSICPKVMKNMLRIYEEFEDEEMVQLVSFTIDPKRDDVGKLNLYSNNLGVTSDRWHFLTGDQDSLLDLADDYFVVAYADADAPGGFDHSGKIILTDKAGHVRGFCEGTEPETIPKFIKDVKKLLAEYK